MLAPEVARREEGEGGSVVVVRFYALSLWYLRAVLKGIRPMVSYSPPVLWSLLEVALMPGWNEGTSARLRANGNEVKALSGSAPKIVI
jgi:hypothetical protein